MHTGGRRGVPDTHFDAFWYILRNACAWRALPAEFGKWGTVFQFWNRLSKAGFTDFVHDRLVCGNEAEAVFFDSTHSKVHQHANEAGTNEERGVGTSRGGLNTKIHAVVDVLGRLAGKLIFTPGNVSDFSVAPALTAELKDVFGVADKGYDSKTIRKDLRARGCEPCIPCRKNTKVPEAYDATLYRARHCVENVWQRIKVFRRVASRFEKTLRMFEFFVILALATIYERDGLWIPM